jgi:hypothetical protein
VPRTVLIVSSGRTGTQFLAHYFDANYANVVGRHEPRPRYRVRLAANAHAAGAFSRDRLVALLARKRRNTIDPLDAELYVESNPFLWGAVDVFDEVFDEPAIVHVVRDPREQVRSALNHGTGAGLKALANRFVPYWYPALPGSPDAGSWLGRAASLWSVVNLRLRDEGARCADYQVVRYESLFDEEKSGLRDLCGRLGLEYRGAGSPVDPARPINVAAGDVLPGWREWSDQQCALLEQIAGPLMSEYGYGDEEEWRARIAAGPAPGGSP